MKLLPNLSSLSLNQQNKRTEETVGTPFAPSTTPVNVTQVNWIELLQTIRYGSEDIEIAFLISTLPPTTSNKNLTLRFVAEKYGSYGTRFLVKSADQDKNHCIEFVIVNPDMDDLAKVSLDSLFYALTDAVLATCEMQPKHREASGAGSIAIEMIQSISAQLGQWMTLTDSASPISRLDGVNIPDWMQGAPLTVTHSIMRGAGYYQRRGFMPDDLVEQVVAAYSEASKVQPLAYFAGFYILQSVLLLWTELIFNTPINQLIEAIRNRFLPALQTIQSTQSTTFPNIPPASEHPIFDLFSKQNIEWHANYLENGLAGSVLKPIDELKLEINDAADDTESDPTMFGVTSFHDFSIRRLMQMATQDNSIFQSNNNRPLNNFKEEVFSFAERAWNFINGQKVISRKLICPLMQNNGVFGYIGVVESNVRGRMPTADFVPVNTNFAVQFESPTLAPGSPNAASPQPPRYFINNDPGAGELQELE